MPHHPIVSYDSTVCLVGGAGISDSAFLLAQQVCQVFVAVDSGADALLTRGVVPERVIGDLDSLSDKARAAFADRLTKIPEQSTTDFEKALTRVAAPCVVAMGFTGGRIDHALAVLNCLARYADRAVVLLDDHDASFVAPVGRTVVQLERGTRLSVMALGRADAVTLTGVVWPFADQMMKPDGFISPSNAALGGDVTLTTSAPVLVTLPRTQLATALQAAARA